jgi:hypothetical protein
MGWEPYDPVLIYGVQYDKFISQAIIRKYKLDIYAGSVCAKTAWNPIYGVKCDFHEVRNGCKNTDVVDKFIEAAKRRGIDFGEPDFHVAISGSLEWEDVLEWPKRGTKRRQSEINEPTNDESENAKDEKC